MRIESRKAQKVLKMVAGTFLLLRRFLKDEKAKRQSRFLQEKTSREE